MSATDLASLAQELKSRARQLGFDRVGITPAEVSPRQAYFRRWLEDGQAGSMAYLTQRFEQRTDPTQYFEGAASLVCLAMNYFVPLEPPQSTAGNPQARIARYALGQDYHELITDRLHSLADWLREQAPNAQTRCCVDTAPVMEKDSAARAGVGWVGKNTCLINEQIGSWLLLGEIVTTLALPADEPAIDRCGSCTRCIDACPTDAITAPYQLDARRCISYLTIEHRGDIEPELAKGIGDSIYGCDICQDVCPFNRKAPGANDPALQPRFASGTIDPNEVLQWDEQQYREKLRGSTIKRVKLPMLKRNARIVVENLG